MSCKIIKKSLIKTFLQYIWSKNDSSRFAATILRKAFKMISAKNNKNRIYPVDLVPVRGSTKVVLLVLWSTKYGAPSSV